MSNFSCPVCAESAKVLESTKIGDRNIVRFKCQHCGEKGVDNVSIEAKPISQGTPWRAQMLDNRKPPKPTREKRDKPKRKQQRKPRKVSLEAQVQQAWMDYALARKAFRAGVVSRAKSDIARDTWIEVSKKLDRLEAKKEKVVA
jgi:hypothetical protein